MLSLLRQGDVLLLVLGPAGRRHCLMDVKTTQEVWHIAVLHVLTCCDKMIGHRCEMTIGRPSETFFLRVSLLILDPGTYEHAIMIIAHQEAHKRILCHGLRPDKVSKSLI